MVWYGMKLVKFPKFTSQSHARLGAFAIDRRVNREKGIHERCVREALDRWGNFPLELLQKLSVLAFVVKGVSERERERERERETICVSSLTSSLASMGLRVRARTLILVNGHGS